MVFTVMNVSPVKAESPNESNEPVEDQSEEEVNYTENYECN